METKHYFLLATQVVYTLEDNQGIIPLNILLVSEEQTVNRAQLGKAQQQAQVRFFTEFDKERKSQVSDVFIQSVSYLGEMTAKDFHGDQYEEPPVATPEAPTEATAPLAMEEPTTTGEDPVV